MTVFAPAGFAVVNEGDVMTSSVIAPQLVQK
jgi:hypothetical protein